MGRGHEESQWIWNVLKDMKLTEENREAIEKAFADTESPLGYYFAGELCEYGSGKEFDHWKQSSDGGCSWGQVQYAWYFRPDDERRLVEKDKKMYLELVKKASAQNNPEVIWRRGLDLEADGEYKEALVKYHMAAELGWQAAKEYLSRMFYDGDGVERNLAQAVYWGSATADDDYFWWVVQ